MNFRPKSAVMVAALAVTVACSRLPGQGERTQVRQEQGEGFTLDIIDNSATFSQALAINASGQMFGIREVVDESGNIFSQENFFFDGQKVTKLPLLKDFTNVEVAALSDTGLIVGYASRPIGNPAGSLTGVVWDSTTGEMTRLMPFPGDTASQAQDISADGRRISGYTNGSQPARLRPCVWNWNPEKNSWDAELLSVLQDFNPYTMTSGVMISPDGLRVSTCITVEELPNGQFDSSLFQWEWADDQWTRRLVSDEQMVVRDMNNRGEIAATYTGRTGRDPCFIDPQGKLTRIGTFAGDVSGEARGINADGTVVGFSDDPNGPEGGPQAFIWKKGKSQALKLPADTVFSSAFGINDRGQIAGLLDVIVSTTDGKQSAAKGSKSDGRKEADAQDTSGDKTAEQDAEPEVKTLAFRWTPQSSL